MRRELPVIITSAVGFVYLVANYFALPAAVRIKAELDKWYLIAVAFGVLVGVINILIVHGRKIAGRKAGMHNSCLLLAAMFGTIAVGLSQTSRGPQYKWLFQYVLVPLGSTMYSILAFYMASAAYRSFRLRSSDATVLLVVAFVVMLGRAPIGELLWGGFPKLSSWVINVPNVAGMRGIGIGAALGGVATALRVIIGLERGHLGGTG